ncbi:MAG: NAD-dependent succinate-semialdehyde dehydrogenase [Candidatus Taylorbacteria bacterium]|nr:NAD-dependent succinate-semialdehyde dehydrogenase [Candidatus Taylorbacteria bacterium]
MSFISTNPATGKIIRRFKEHTAAETERKLVDAKRAQSAWRVVPLKNRVRLAMKLAALLRKQKHELGQLMTQEMGKPIRAAIAEIEKCAWATEYFAENAERFLSPEYVKTDASESFISFEPLGIVLGIMPWNFPYWQVLRYAIPALLSGNAAFLKHASTVSGCALRTEELFREAGFPKGLFQVLLIETEKIPAIIADPRVSAVTLTGSERAGSIVASLAGKAVKKSILELGGSDPFIVLADADLAEAAHTGARARLQNAGQSCIAAKRFIVARQKEKLFTKLLAARFKEMIVGDGTDEKTDVGPLSSERMLRGLERQVAESVALGANVVCGGKRIDRAGYFYEPTILTHVKKGMPVYDEEVFGPVAAVIGVKDEEEAIRVANDTPYGLGASVWTKNLARAKRIIPRIESGSVFVNDMVKSDPRLPFGGIKQSGYGRELSGFGLREFTNIKTVYIK